jgi:DIS3-like exonuclease 2
MLHKLTKLVRSQRIESGSLIIENEEVAFDINEESNYPVGFRIKTKSDSNHLIEELMLIANKLTAELLYEHIKDFALIRKHPFLNDNKFLEIQRYLSMNKLVVDFEDPQALNDMLFKIKKQNQNKYLCIQRKLKNFMQRAEYVISGYQEYEDLRHSALNFDLYTHFTSPIRRYPDMIVHRQLKYVLKKIKTGVLDLNEFSGFERFIDIFNEKYINGKMISSRCQKVFHCILLKNMPTFIYKALVVDINYKSNSKNKRNSIQNMTGMETGPSLSVCIFIPSLNLEMVN